MLSNWNKYLYTLDIALSVEPEWMAPSITKAMSSVVSKIDSSARMISQTDQGSLNRHIFSKAKKYNNEMMQVTINEKDSYLFDEARLFPIHNMEWCLATLEFFTEYFYEMSWISKKAFAKIFRITSEKYGNDVAYDMITSAASWIDNKNNDWNRILYGIVDFVKDSFEYNVENNYKSITKSEIFIGELISETSNHMWSAKDRISMVEHMKDTKRINPYVRTSVIMFNILSSINVKTKRKKILDFEYVS